MDTVFELGIWKFGLGFRVFAGFEIEGSFAGFCRVLRLGRVFCWGFEIRGFVECLGLGFVGLCYRGVL